jgi:hypothetical protein
MVSVRFVNGHQRPESVTAAFDFDSGPEPVCLGGWKIDAKLINDGFRSGG